jgi:hypothetical protein
VEALKTLPAQEAAVWRDESQLSHTGTGEEGFEIQWETWISYRLSPQGPLAVVEELQTAAQGGDLRRLEAAIEAWEAQGPNFISSLELSHPGVWSHSWARRAELKAAEVELSDLVAAARSQTLKPGLSETFHRDSRRSTDKSRLQKRRSRLLQEATTLTDRTVELRERLGRARDVVGLEGPALLKAHNTIQELEAREVKLLEKFQELCAPIERELQSCQTMSAMPSQIIRNALVGAAAEPGADGLLGEETARIAAELGFRPEDAPEIWSAKLKAKKSPWGGLFRNAVKVFDRARNREWAVKATVGLLSEGAGKAGAPGSTALRRFAGKWQRARASTELAERRGVRPSVYAASDED